MNRFHKIFFVVKYWLCWILLFEAARIFFLLSNFAEAKHLGYANISGTLWYGMRMDMSMAAYITLPVALIVLAGIFIPLLRKPAIFKIYTGVVLFFILLLVGTDINIYKAWGFRVDASPLKYLKNPAEAWASVANLPVVWILLALVFAMVMISWMFNRFISRNNIASSEKKMPSWLHGVLLLLVTALFIIPLRGGFQLAPLNQSSVYFSENNFANQAAINAPWNFLHSVTHNTESKTNPFIYLDPTQATGIKNELFASDGLSQQLLQLEPGTQPNVIFVVWESFTEKATHLSIDGVEVTPRFNELKKEGIYFSNIYASGDRTDKGIVAVLSGYPAQPTTSIVKTPVKASRLPMISKQLAAAGYNTSFYYGGELEFANMKAYLLSGNFKKFTSKSDFEAKDQNSKWGAHDGVVMQKVMENLKTEQQPFFCTWLTLSSHEPFEVPVDAVIKGTDDASLFLNSLHYTDQVLYDFIRQCKQQSWWNNTLVVVTADHGHRLPTSNKIGDFKMPVMFLGGILQQKGTVQARIASQVDIPATVLTQLGRSSKDFVWSRNMLDSSAMPWAYFCFNNGYGFVSPGNYYIFDNVGKKPIEQAGLLPDSIIIRGKAIQQLSFEDYLTK